MHDHLIPLDGIKAVIVDDTGVVMDFFKLLLKHTGMETHFFQSPQAALEFLKKSSSEIDIVLLDIIMPKMDGYTLAREIRKFDTTIKLLAHTASPEIEIDQNCKDAGINDYILKPIYMHKLHEKITVLLEHK